MYNGINIIAEVKTHSPFGWRSSKTWDALFKIAEEIGDIISVHTDPRWGGSFELLKHARTLTAKPILAKGIHALDRDILEARDSGADFVLVVGRIPETELTKCIIEPFTLAELREIPEECRAVWNSRDLTTGGLKAETFEEARRLFPGWICQASHLKTVADIHPGAEAVLVGTHLETFAASIR
ncbi:MAG: hypothetical protein Q7R93_00025 [bacterium]|nr:hypothetical protein [bacterium]